MSSVGEPAWSDAWLTDDEQSRVEHSASGGVRDLVFDQLPAAASLVEAARALSSVDPAVLSADERLGVLDALESVDRMLAGATMRHLVAVEERAEIDARCGMTPGAYSEQRHGKDRLTWVGQIRRGRSLATRMPDVFAALCDGRISRDRAELVAVALNDRNAGLLGAAQQALLDLSDAEPRFREFAHQLRALATIADQDGPEPQAEDSTARVTRSGDHLAVVMDIYGVDAVTVEQLISSAVAALRRRWQADVDANPELVMPTGAHLREQAIVELIIRGAGADPTASRPTVAKLTLLVDADRADDLDPLLASVLSGVGTDGFMRTDSGGPSLRLVNPFTGPGAHESCGGCGDHHPVPNRFRNRQFLVSTPDGDRVELTAQQFQLLVCDADISEVLLDVLGEPVAVRDRSRLAGSRMRTALIARDGGCTFPGCDAPAGWCDAHHVIEYSKGGATVIVNMALLCRRHHGIVHRLGWSMERSTAPGVSGGFFTITTPYGLELHTQHRSRPANPGEPPRRRSVPA